MTPDEQAVMGGAVAAAVLCFLPWVSVSAGAEMGELAEALKGLGGQGLGGKSLSSSNALHSTEGVLAFILSLVTAAVPFANARGLVKLDKQLVSVLPLLTSAVALICALIFVLRAGGGDIPFVTVSRTIWSFLALGALGFTVFRAYKLQRAAQPPAQTGVTP